MKVTFLGQQTFNPPTIFETLSTKRFSKRVLEKKNSKSVLEEKNSKRCSRKNFSVLETFQCSRNFAPKLSKLYNLESIPRVEVFSHLYKQGKHRVSNGTKCVLETFVI